MGGRLADMGGPLADQWALWPIDTTTDMGGPLVAGGPMTYKGGPLAEIGGP